MNLGYFADGPWAHEALRAILERSELKVAFICGRNDGKDEVLPRMAIENDIPFLRDSNVNGEKFLDCIEAYGADLFVSMSFDQIFGEPFINLPRLGVINCHAGKLPFYRGRNVLNWALINDEREFGVTVHFVDDGVDTGDIINQKCFPITDSDDYGTLLERAYVECAEVLLETLAEIQKGKAIRQKQSSVHPHGFYCSGRTPGDERLDWNQSSRRVFNFVRALSDPGPSARSFKGQDEILIKRVEWIEDAPAYIGIPGAVLAADNESLLIKTADSYVRLTDWEGAVKLKVGDRLT